MNRTNLSNSNKMLRNKSHNGKKIDKNGRQIIARDKVNLIIGAKLKVKFSKSKYRKQN